jgi:hypothetical protein
VPGISRGLKEKEELVYDPKAYLMLHTFQTSLFFADIEVILTFPV